MKGGTDIFWLLFWLKHLIFILYGQTNNTAVINLCARRFYIKKFYQYRGVRLLETGYDFMFLSNGLKRVRLFGMGTHFFPENLARGMLIRVGMFIRDGYAFFSQKFG